MKIASVEKKLIDKLVEECTETNNKVKVAKITLAENENKHKRCSCTLYIMLFLIIFTINAAISTYFVTTNTWIVIKKLIVKKKFTF